MRRPGRATRWRRPWRSPPRPRQPRRPGRPSAPSRPAARAPGLRSPARPRRVRRTDRRRRAPRGPAAGRAGPTPAPARLSARRGGGGGAHGVGMVTEGNNPGTTSMQPADARWCSGPVSATTRTPQRPSRSRVRRSRSRSSKVSSSWVSRALKEPSGSPREPNPRTRRRSAVLGTSGAVLFQGERFQRAAIEFGPGAETGGEVVRGENPGRERSPPCPDHQRLLPRV